MKRAARLLGGLMATAQAAETALEALLLARFVERLGAAGLPLALALRASVDAAGSLLVERAFAKHSVSARLAGALALGAGLCAVTLALPGNSAALYIAFVSCSLVARVRSIDFGVLCLDVLPRGSREAELPGIYAAGRLGSMASGALLLLLGSTSGVLVASGGAFVAGAVLALKLRTEQAPSSSNEQAAPRSEIADPARSRWLLRALILGALSLSAGRVALTTQSGSILAAEFDEQRLVQVLGAYNIVAAAVALGLQLSYAKRLLQSGRLELLNGLWAAAYLLGQLGLGFGPPGALVALSARFVDGELRAAIRGPITTLLYEAMPRRERRLARTWVIGVSVPLSALVAGLVLSQLSSGTALLLAGVAAGVLVAVSSLVQGRLWAKARLDLSSDRERG